MHGFIRRIRFADRENSQRKDLLLLALICVRRTPSSLSRGASSTLLGRKRATAFSTSAREVLSDLISCTRSRSTKRSRLEPSEENTGSPSIASWAQCLASVTSRRSRGQ